MNKKNILKTIPLLVFSLSAVANPFVSPKEPSAKLVMNQSQPTKQLFEMNLIEVNGKNIQDRGSVVWLKPGEYDLSFNAKINHNYTKGQLSKKTSANRHMNNDMSISLEAGKTYYMAYDAKDRDSKNWKPVVYKTK